MCKYCENGDSIYYDEHGKDIINEVVIEDDNTLTIGINGSVEVGETYCVVLDIDYCPKCGRKLKEVNNKMKINEILKEDNIGKYYKSTLGDNIVYQVVRYGINDLNLHSENDGYIDDEFCVYAIINAEFEEVKIIKMTKSEKLLYDLLVSMKDIEITKVTEPVVNALEYIVDKFDISAKDDVEIEVID